MNPFLEDGILLQHWIRLILRIFSCVQENLQIFFTSVIESLISSSFLKNGFNVQTSPLWSFSLPSLPSSLEAMELQRLDRRFCTVVRRLRLLFLISSADLPLLYTCKTVVSCPLYSPLRTFSPSLSRLGHSFWSNLFSNSFPAFSGGGMQNFIQPCYWGKLCLR